MTHPPSEQSDRDEPIDDTSEDETSEEEEDLGDHDSKDTAEYDLSRFLEDVMEEGKLDWSHEEGIWTQYPLLYKNSELDGKNVLHKLIQAYSFPKTSKTNKETIKTSIMKITAKYPELVQMRDVVDHDSQGEAGETPLMAALIGGKSNVVKFIIDGCTTTPSTSAARKAARKALSRALAVRCTVGGRTENPLHWLMQNPTKYSRTRKLVERAPKEAVVSQDTYGFTPLHYAVDYKHSSESQLGLVKTLLKIGETEGPEGPGGPEKCVLDLLTKRDKLSVYQYHVRSREAETSATETQAPFSLVRRQTGRDAFGIELLGLNGYARSRRQGGDRSETHSGMPQRNKANRELEDDFVTVAKEGSTGSRSMLSDEEKKKRNEYADAIGMEIKLQYFRSSRSYEQVVKLLHGNNPKDIQLSLDYQKLPGEIDADIFIESLKAVQYDQVLDYVHLPAVRVKRLPTHFKKGINIQGRSDLLFFFHWLRKKGVKRIIKVIVQDDPETPHSDEAIQAALRPFNVEYLDWKKTDLDPETIIEVGDSLVDIVLYWGGNNAVLRAWSEPYGLFQLPHLSTVHLRRDHTKNSESPATLFSNIEKFKQRLRGNYETRKTTETPDFSSSVTSVAIKPDTKESLPSKTVRSIEVLVSPTDMPMLQQNLSISPSMLSGMAREQASSHRWLQTTDAFAECIQNVWHKISQERDVKRQEVIVALIDDGVYTLQDKLIGHVLPGRSYEYDAQTGRVSSWLESAEGHGTLMASLICRVCPMVRIYPIRLKANARGEIDTQCAIYAIQAAVARGVDIISMSWTVSRPNGDLRDEFDRALKSAIDNQVLMLCSSKDSGQNSDCYYPRDYAPQSLITVGAADATGTADNWAGPTEKLDFLFPGVKVMQSHEPLQKGVADMKESNGSSVATALGAGLAALILYCAQIGEMYGKGDITSVDVKNLHERDAMVRAIHSFNKSLQTSINNKFVQVWQKLDDMTKNLNTGTADTHRAKIAEFARDLITK